MYVYERTLRNIVTIKQPVFRYYDPNAKKRRELHEFRACITWIRENPAMNHDNRQD